MQPVNDIEQLHPSMQALAVEFMALCYFRGLHVLIYETYRSPERQMELYKKGYSKLKKGGMHEYRVAFDAVFKGNEPWGEKHPWEKLGQVGKDIGLYWGGDWRSFQDRPHFQIVPAKPKPQSRIRSGQVPAPLPPTLEKGDYGPTVKILQQLLNIKNNARLTVDGEYGGKTHKAIEVFQSKLTLTPDGVCRGGVWVNLIDRFYK
jgi:peptidoglycan L-alanyl-D-glutamate endopeptidase CwlK